MDWHLPVRCACLEVMVCAVVDIEDPDILDLTNVGDVQLSDFAKAHAREQADQRDPEILKVLQRGSVCLTDVPLSENTL